MSHEHSPSVDLALSLATPQPLSRDRGHRVPETPSALPRAESSERRAFEDEYLGPVEELTQRFPLGEGVGIIVRWLLDPEEPEATLKHVRSLELEVEGSRVPLRRGQIDAVLSAMGLAEYVFETAEREELARRTC